MLPRPGMAALPWCLPVCHPDAASRPRDLLFVLPHTLPRPGMAALPWCHSERSEESLLRTSLGTPRFAVSSRGHVLAEGAAFGLLSAVSSRGHVLAEGAAFGLLSAVSSRGHVLAEGAAFGLLSAVSSRGPLFSPRDLLLDLWVPHTPILRVGPEPL